MKQNMLSLQQSPAEQSPLSVEILSGGKTEQASNTSSANQNWMESISTSVITERRKAEERENYKVW